MTLAPIRGAPPGAPNPDFPIAEPKVKPVEPTTAPASDDQPPTPPVRQRNAPIEINGAGITFTFKVIPEQPAIARASMTIHVAAGSHAVGFLRMSASNARKFLTDLRNDQPRIVATGNEDGDVQIEYDSTGGEPVLMVRRPAERNPLGRWMLDRDLKTAVDELLADLGA